MNPNTYRSAGVDIGKGDAFTDFIKRFPSPAVSTSIGGFSGAVEFDAQKYRHPLLLSTTDGVGTKLIVAQRLGRFDTVGIDLVAMSVNDLAVCGAAPLSFLDYIAVGKIDENVLHEIIRGVIRGCEIAGCTLAGGETAELPDMYRPGEFDLAGFCTGIVDRESLLPRTTQMAEGDAIVGLPSSGIHSNGLSLARKVIRDEDAASWNALLEPTRIYVSELERLFPTGAVLGAAHITGGGLHDNFVRVIPHDLTPRFTWNWPVPEIFGTIQKSGSIETSEMRAVFNMGIGIAMVVQRSRVQDFLKFAADAEIGVLEIGELVRG